MAKQTITIKNKGAKYEVQAPETWNDLEHRDLLLIYSTLFQNPFSEHVKHNFTTFKLISIARHLLRIDDVLLATWESDSILSDPETGQQTFYDELRQVVRAAVGGLFEITEEDGNTLYSTALNLTNNPYPEILLNEKAKGNRTKVTWFYGPKNGLENITIYELGYTFTLFEQYVETQDEKYVHELLAVLYRPSRPRRAEDAVNDWGGDRRVKLRGYESKAEERRETMAKLNVIVKRVVLFWFASCRQQIINRYPEVFARRSAVNTSDSAKYGWAGVLLGLAGGVADLDKVSDTHYSNALTWLAMQPD